MDPGASADPAPGRGVGLDTPLIVVVLVGAAMFAAGRLTAPAPPGDTSPEAGFGRDMQVHHIQGVDMAMIIRDNTDDEEIRRLAYDTATTQAHQAGQLYGWLVEWGLGQLGSEPPMMWMMRPGRSGEVMEMGDAPMRMDALMPGMATDEEMAELAAASGLEAERLFLELMLEHHQGTCGHFRRAVPRLEHLAPHRDDKGPRKNKVCIVAADASRRAALLVACIRPVCALLAPCRAGASTPTMHTLFFRGP